MLVVIKKLIVKRGNPCACVGHVPPTHLLHFSWRLVSTRYGFCLRFSVSDAMKIATGIDRVSTVCIVYCGDMRMID